MFWHVICIHLSQRLKLYVLVNNFSVMSGRFPGLNHSVLSNDDEDPRIRHTMSITFIFPKLTVASFTLGTSSGTVMTIFVSHSFNTLVKSSEE